jgi:hypothetical protein
VYVRFALRGREQFLIFPAKVPAINIPGVALSELARRFPRN